MIAQELEVSLHMAFVEARQQRHEFITVEHLLLALLDNPSAAEVLRACSANVEDLRKSLSNFIKDNTPQVAGTDDVDTQPTLGFQRVIQRAIMHVQSTGNGKKEVINRGDKVSGQIKSITDFGIFIGLSGNIDGLVHLSDISWDVPGEEAVRNFQKGQTIEAMVLAIDPERERISLGIKQLAKDPFAGYIADNPKGSIVRGVVKDVDARGAVIDLGNGIEGQLRASELGRDRVEDARQFLKAGDEIEAKFMGVDRKTRSISLSIKAKEANEEAEALQSYRSEQGGPTSGTSLGELLKAQINSDRDRG